MPFDREDTLKKAEKLLRQGRLEPAIAEYLRVVEQDPGDWITSNTLGDLYVRAGQAEKAAEQYRRIAEHFMLEGFLPKAAALYKKLLKLTPDDEHTYLNLAEISQRQGLLADAKNYLNTIAGRRRQRGDRAGEAEIVVRLGAVDPNDIEARLAAARTLGQMGDEEEAAASYRRLYDDLMEKDRGPEALAALREAVAHNPHDHDGRVVLAKAAVGAGDIETARTYLDRETAGSDPALQMALLEIDLGSGHYDDARDVLRSIVARGPDGRGRALDLAWSTTETNPEAGFVLVEALVESDAAAGQHARSAQVLQDYVRRVPNHVPALLKLIEVCVDGVLESTLNEAQAQLADAYLGAGQAGEARVIAEDLVAREPWERAHLDRFRRALLMLKVPEPDMVIAERLNGQTPFIATDPFADVAPAADAPNESSESADQPSDEPGPFSQLVDYADGAADEEPAGDVTPPAAHHGDEIDLSGVLGLEEEPAGELAAAAAPSLADAFSSLREEAGRSQGPDLSAQNMILARTYLDMGQPDQAIRPLTSAAKSPAFRFEAASRLGRLYLDRGDMAQAAEWLERAAEAPAPSVDDGRAVAYDFAAALEAVGETSRALALFLELQADDAAYRDVAARVERLARVETETGG